MQQPQESAAETKSQRHGGLRLIVQGCIIELQLLQRIPQIRILCAVRRIHAAVDHGLNLLVSGQGLGAGTRIVRHCIPYLRILHILDGRHDISHHTRGQLLTREKRTRPEVSYFHHFFPCPRCHHPDHRALFYGSLHDTAEDYDSFIGIIDRIEDQRLQRSLRIPLGGRNLRHDLLQHLLDAYTVLGGDQRRVLSLQTDHVLDFLYNPLRLRAGQIDLIDDRKYIQVVIQRKIYIGQRLGLDPLRCIHHQNRPVAGRQ